MKRSLKILSFVFMFALLVTLGCLAVAAGPAIGADDAAKADIQVDAHDYMTYTDEQGYTWTIANPTDEPLVARYYSDYDRYAFGVYTLKTTNVSKPYGTSWTAGWDGRGEDWVSSLLYANDQSYNIHVALGDNTFNDAGLNAGVYPNANAVDTITFSLVLRGANGGISYAGDIAVMDAQNPETCESFILDATWGSVELISGTITVDTTTAAWTGIYDGLAHGGALTATPADSDYLVGTPVTVSYSLDNESFDTVAPTFINAGEYVVYYKAEAANHYTATGTYTVTINQRDIADADIVVSDLSFVYDGSAQAPSVTEMSLPGLTLTPADFDLVYDEEISVGEYTLTINGKGNYTGSTTATWEITQASNAWAVLPTIDGWTYTHLHATSPASIPSATPVYGAVKYEYKVALASDDTYTEYDPAVYGKYPLNAGNYTLRAYVEETNDYAGVAYYEVDFTIAKADFDFTGISLVQVGELIYNGTTQTAVTNVDDLVADAIIPMYVSATGLTYDLTNVLDSCDVAFTLTFANYNDWTGTWRAQMTPKSVTILTNSASQVYNGQPLSAPGFEIVEGGLCGNDSLFVSTYVPAFSSITYITADNLNVSDNNGSVANVLEYLPADINPNYTIDTSLCGTLTIIPAPLTLVFANNGAVSNFVYDGREHIFTPTLQGQFRGAVSGELVGLSTTSVDIRGTNAGTYDIAPEQLSIYALGGVAHTVDTTLCYSLNVEASPRLVIAQKPVSSVAIDNVTIAYGDAIPTYTFTAAGLVYGESLNNVEMVGDYEQIASCGVGTYRIYFADIDAIRAANPNYSFADDIFAEATLTVVPMDIDNVVWTIPDGTLVYNGGELGPVATAAGAYGQLLQIETNTGIDAGFYWAEALSILADDSYNLDNYNLIESDVSFFVIDPKPIDSISILNETVCYGDAVPTYGYTVNGLVSGESLTNVVLVGDYLQIAEHGVGTYGIYFADRDMIRAANPNYYFADDIFAEATLTVKPMPIYNVAWDGYDFPYNGYEQGPTAIAVGAYGQILNIESTKETYVGSYEAVAKSILPDAYYDLDNYILVKFGMDTGFFTISEIEEIAFTSANVVIGDDYTINFKVPVLAFEQYGLVDDADIVVEMELGDRTFIVGYSDIQTVNYGGSLVDFYVFSFENIQPQNIGETVTAWLDIGDSFDYREYSVAEYCYNQLKKNGQDERFATALVALLRYAAAAQKFVNPDIADEALVTYKLENDPAYAVFNDYYTTTDYEDNDNGSGFNPAIIAGHSISVTLDNGANLIYLLDTNGVEIPEINFVVNGVAYTGEIAWVGDRYQIVIPVAFANVGVEYKIETFAGDTLIAFAYRSIEGYTANASGAAQSVAGALVDFGTILDKYLKGEDIDHQAPIPAVIE